tara:strand:+ start:4498 stop:5382 length:885 start_codon:yes stop_codon:yes gene_type:complete
MMSLEDKLEYNIKSAEDFGWSPDWFDATNFDEDLILKIEQFQYSLGLDCDGLIGPLTYRRIITAREALEDNDDTEEDERTTHNHLVFNGKHYPIEWDKVKLWDDEGGLKAKNYKRWRKKEPRDIKMFVTHWDASLSSKSCQKILDRRGLSCHFLISASGIVYQTADLNDVTFHCGGLNYQTVGCEINNAYYTKYQGYYEKRGFGSRPLCKNSIVRGKKLRTHLGFYNVQLRALQAILKCLTHPDIGLKLETPDSTWPVKEVMNKSYRGVVHHYHASANKIDCGGLDLQKLIDEM